MAEEESDETPLWLELIVDRELLPAPTNCFFVKRGVRVDGYIHRIRKNFRNEATSIKKEIKI